MQSARPRMAAKPSTTTIVLRAQRALERKSSVRATPLYGVRRSATGRIRCGELDAVLQLSPILLVLVLDGLVRSKTRDEFEDEALVRRLDLILVVTPVVEAMTRAPSPPSA